MNKKVLKAITQILPASQRKKGVIMIALLCVSSVLDFFSLAFFLPIILLVVNPNYALQNKYLSNLFHLSGLQDHSHFAIAITILVIIFLAIKTQVIRWIVYVKANYAYHVADDLAAKGMASYLNSDYVQFTGSDFSRQANRITQLPLIFANNIIIPAGTIVSESIVAVLLLAGVILFDIRVFAFLTIIFAPLIIIYFIKKRQLKKISQKIKTTYPQLLKNTLQVVEGWMEIKSLQKESFFKDRFNSQYKILTGTYAKEHVSNTSPVRITELIAALCIGSLIIYSIWSQQPYQQTLLLLSVYAGVSFRVIPLLSRIFAALLQMKSHEYVLDELKTNVYPDKKKGNTSGLPIAFENLVLLSEISFGYENHPFILDRISLTIRKGERIVITGESGSGKTSLLLILLRFLKETNGGIRVDQLELTERHTSAWQKLIGYVPQNPYLLDGSIAENIAFGISLENIDITKVEQAAEQAELSQWIDTLPEKAATMLGEKGAKISGGQRQRIALARAFYHDAEILILDESTNQLDSKTEAEIAQTILQNQTSSKTIIMVSHSEKLWDHFDTIYQLHKGKLEKFFSNALI